MTPQASGPSGNDVEGLAGRLRKHAGILEDHAKRRRLPPGDNDFEDAARFMRQAAAALASLQAQQVVKAERQAIWDAIEARITSAPKDGISAAGNYSVAVARQQDAFIDGLRVARNAVLALAAAPSPSTEGDSTNAG